ncbi:HPr kinase/phosphorylase [Roseobacteraceae bacterium NS-SX3]
MPEDAPLCLHASCVALKGRALLIRGGSGSGKSALALELMAYGARLVADDRVLVAAEEGTLIARAPDSIRGLIEARGVGLLRADVLGAARLCAIVNMDAVETERLPLHVSEEILGLRLPVLRRAGAAHFAPALIQYLKGGVADPDAGL